MQSALTVLQVLTVGSDDLFIPICAVLEGALLGAVVNEHQTKTDIVAAGPFIVIRKAPLLVADDRDPLVSGTAQFQQVTVQEVNAAATMDVTVQRHPVPAGIAVLGNENGLLVAVIEELCGPVQCFRVTFQPMVLLGEP